MRLEARLDALVADGPMPGAQLSVLEADGTVMTAASGVTNLRTGQPVTTETLFQIGSITKTWTATAIMQLVDEGRVDLDVPLRTYLPDFAVADDQVAARVTLRHVLTHTSGIEADVFADTGRNDDCLERYVAALAGQGSIHALEETWSYCNAGFPVAGRVIEVLDGKPYEQAMRDRLATPLGIEAFAWGADEAILWGAAVGHVQGPAGNLSVTPVFSLPRSMAPAGLLTISTRDLLAYAALHLDGGGGLAAMQVPQAPCPSYLADDWGIGWMLHGWDGGPVVGHGGATLGQHAELLLVPHRKVAVALAVNGPMGPGYHTLLRDLLGELAEVSMPPLPQPHDPLPAVEVARYAGTYSRHDVTVTVGGEGDDQLVMHTRYGGDLARALGLTEDPPAPLVPHTGDGEFLSPHPRAPGTWVPVRFYGGEAGDPPVFMHAGGRAHRRRPTS